MVQLTAVLKPESSQKSKVIKTLKLMIEELSSEDNTEEDTDDHPKNNSANDGNY